MNYQVVFQREGHNIETIVWNGPLTETRKLARKVAVLLDSDVFRIIDLTSGEDVCFEQRPFVNPADR
jgi:hypothetical protein